jgi:cell division protein FtsA
MNSKNFETYFDFGSSKIRVGAINNNDLSNSFFYKSESFSQYIKSELEIEKIILNLEKDTKEYLDSINLMVDSPLIKSISLSLSKNLDGSKLKKENFEFLIQDGKQQILRNYADFNILHIIIKNYKIDDKDYNYLPDNIKCNSLSVDIIFVCLPKEVIQDLKKLFQKFDVSVKQIFCSSYVKSVSYKDNFTTIENIAFIDIGFNKTSIVSYRNNHISFLQIIPIGGNHITKDISKVLNIDLIDAEKIKLSFDKDENILNKKKLSQNLVQKIIFARIEEILEICTKNIKLNDDNEQFIHHKLILMGEGSKILDNKFKDKISFSHKIDLLEETTRGIFESVTKLSKGLSKQEVVIVPKKHIKVGFFEKLFHFFS